MTFLLDETIFTLSIMPPAGSVVCFMCQGHVPYSPAQPGKFERHMKNDHSVFFGLEFLLAGCRMSEEERNTVNEVVGEKDGVEDTSEPEPSPEIFIPVPTLEEGEMVGELDVGSIKRENISANSHHCDFCQKSFTVLDNLQEHISRRHPSNQTANNQKRRSKLPRGFQNKNTKMISRQKRPNNTRRQSQDVHDGEGFPCKECGKVFRTKAMAEFHYTDVHVSGHFPCKGGCGKIFTSKNKMSSHWSRHCNPRNKKRTSL